MILLIAHFFAITSFFACYKIKFKKISTEKKHLFVCLLNFFFVWLLNWIRGYLKRTKFRTILFSFRDTFLSKLIDTSTNLSICHIKIYLSIYLYTIYYISIYLSTLSCPWSILFGTLSKFHGRLQTLSDLIRSLTI